MARRSDHSREEIYDMALKAAREIVTRDGLQALTARRVAEAIGYSPGTLYNVFDDLDDLIIHLNGRTLDELYAYLSPAADVDEPSDDLKLLLERYLGYLDNYRNLFNVLIEYRLPDSRILPDWYMAKLQRLLGLLESALSPFFPPEEQSAAARAAEVLWASLHGICSLSDADKLQLVSDQNVREMAEMLIACFTAGLRQMSEK